MTSRKLDFESYVKIFYNEFNDKKKSAGENYLSVDKKYSFNKNLVGENKWSN